MMTRRLFALAAVGLGLALAQPAAAQTREKLTLLLDWFVNPDHAPILVAKDNGLFQKHGLDVEIIEPSDPSAPPRLIAAGQGDIAISYQPSFTRAVKNGIPVIRIGTLVATPLNTLTVLADGPVKTLADLKGRTIGYSGSGIHDMMLKTMLKRSRQPLWLAGPTRSSAVSATLKARKSSWRARSRRCSFPRSMACRPMTS
jgi:putative hydroxymethylpyrimidine transport system substrate-binding protein